MIPGKPIAKQRPRFGKGKVFTPPETVAYEQSVAWAAKIAMKGRPILTGPVELSIIASFGGKERGWHTKKPDITNICKALEDAMNGIVYKDDSQVCMLSFKKFKSIDDFVEVVVQPLD